MTMRKFCMPVAVAGILLSATVRGRGQAEPAAVTLVAAGQAQLPVVVSPDAPAQVSQAAAELAEFLGRISGGEFEVIVGEGARGIVVGLPESFPQLPFAVDFEEGPLRREDYLLRSTAGGIYLLGATPLGVQNAVWDLLHRFGYRMYFPTPTWEVIPSDPELRIVVDEFGRPDYYSRRIWHATPEWSRRNRAASGFQLNTSHAYGGIIRRHREVFDAHPEYLALRDGERGGSKFCISNPGLRALVVQDAVARVDETTDSISLDPSDGGGWCECADCAAMGSVSDRVVILANAVAEAVNALDLGPKFVGIYAYNAHSPPPSVAIHPNVIVSIATSFIRGGFTADELIEQWGERAAMLGLREYYYSYANLPGGGRATDLLYLTRTLTQYHARGTRFNSANIHDAWGPTGLGHYLMARSCGMWEWQDKSKPNSKIFCNAPSARPMSRCGASTAG